MCHDDRRHDQDHDCDHAPFGSENIQSSPRRKGEKEKRKKKMKRKEEKECEYQVQSGGSHSNKCITRSNKCMTCELTGMIRYEL